nr:hypothetical protein [Dysgonomonas sp.]
MGSGVFNYPDIITTSMTLTGNILAVPTVVRASGKIQELNITDKQDVKEENCLAVIENPSNTNDIRILKLLYRMSSIYGY